MSASGRDHMLPWPAGEGIESQTARYEGVLDALEELARASHEAVHGWRAPLAPFAVLARRLISMYSHRCELPRELKDALEARIASMLANALVDEPQVWAGVDDCVAQFFKNVKKASGTLTTTIAVFVRLALENPCKFVSALSLAVDLPMRKTPRTASELAGLVAEYNNFELHPRTATRAAVAMVKAGHAAPAELAAMPDKELHALLLDLGADVIIDRVIPKSESLERMRLHSRVDVLRARDEPAAKRQRTGEA
jgi:hypothetical protein